MKKSIEEAKNAADEAKPRGSIPSEVEGKVTSFNHDVLCLKSGLKRLKSI
jgi:hypothetical protein